MASSTTYASYVVVLVVLLVFWGTFASMFKTFTKTMMDVKYEIVRTLNESASKVGVTPSMLSETVSQLDPVVKFLANLLSNETTLAVLIALSLIISAYLAKR